jgi:hypothetical protein
MDPYSWVFQNPHLLLFYCGAITLLAGWVYLSARKLVSWGVSITTALTERWGKSEPLPPDDVTTEIFFFTVVLAVDLWLIGAFVFWVM